MDAARHGTKKVTLADIVAMRERVHQKYLQAQHTHEEAADLEDELKRLMVAYTRGQNEHETVAG